jgi:hypothetical protein
LPTSAHYTARLFAKVGDNRRGLDNFQMAIRGQGVLDEEFKPRQGLVDED